MSYAVVTTITLSAEIPVIHRIIFAHIRYILTNRVLMTGIALIAQTHMDHPLDHPYEFSRTHSDNAKKLQDASILRIHLRA